MLSSALLPHDGEDGCADAASKQTISGVLANLMAKSSTGNKNENQNKKTDEGKLMERGGVGMVEKNDRTK